MSEKATETKPTAPETPAAPAVKTYSEAEYNALQEKLASTEKQLAEANTTIQSFKDMDIEGIKKSADDWKQKAEQAEAERKAFEHRTKLQAYVKGLHLRDEIYEEHVTKLLEEKGLKFEGDKLIGGDDVVQTFREGHADVSFLHSAVSLSADLRYILSCSISGHDGCIMNPKAAVLSVKHSGFFGLF